MAPLYRILLYLFPAPLGLLEWLIRQRSPSSDATEFLGPALCSAALALLLPVIVPKTVPGEALKLNLPKGYRLRKKDDDAIVVVGIISLLLGISLWGVCLHLSLGGELFSPLKEWTAGRNKQFGIGAILYTVAVFLTEAKERV